MSHGWGPLRRTWFNLTWPLRSRLRELLFRIEVARIDPRNIERVSLDRSDHFGHLLIDRWPQDRETATGVRSDYARANRQEVMFMDNDFRGFVLGLIEAWLRDLDGSPPQRDDELIEALDDIECIVEPHRRALRHVV